MGAESSKDSSEEKTWISLGDFADVIKNREEERMKSIFEIADENPEEYNFHGFSPLAIASMHSNGMWVIDRFAREERTNEPSSVNLVELANELSLNVDEDILQATGFTPISLAVMFGPVDSVRLLIDKGAKLDFVTEGQKIFSLKNLAEFRGSEDILKLLDEDGVHGQCHHCDVKNCVIS
mmetsp:Transcript_46498/g.74764  ORF Transcript_46498/g.74764 Transcript_46498/m.74764 type:complete len:180 (+) Transcript_46498:79-618(+)